MWFISNQISSAHLRSFCFSKGDIEEESIISGYGRSYKIEIVDKRDAVIQLKASKIVIKDLFKDLLVELKGFKYQITLCILLTKVKSSDLTEYSPVYFNSLTKTVIGNLLVLGILLVSVLMK